MAEMNLRERLRKEGLNELPPQHPIFREGSIVSFLNPPSSSLTNLESEPEEQMESPSIRPEEE